MLAIIAPHPDDDVLCCSGVIYRNADNVMVIYVTDGSKGSPRRQEWGRGLALRRMNEAYSALSRLGVKNMDSVVFLGIEDGSVDKNYCKVYNQLLNLLKKDNITEIYFPSPLDFHPDHSATGRAILSLAESGLIGKDKVLYMYIIHRPPIISVRYLKYLTDLIKLRLTWKKICMKADPELKIEALRRHESQFPYLNTRLKGSASKGYECFYFRRL